MQLDPLQHTICIIKSTTQLLFQTGPLLDVRLAVHHTPLEPHFLIPPTPLPHILLVHKKSLGNQAVEGRGKR
jgi:hypothetical protein